MYVSKFHLIFFVSFLCASFDIKDDYERKYALKMLTFFVKGLNNLERQGFKWLHKEIKICLEWWKGRCFLAPKKNLNFFWKYVWVQIKFEYLGFMIATKKRLFLGLYECQQSLSIYVF
jgi:hypothetical protein